MSATTTIVNPSSNRMSAIDVTQEQQLKRQFLTLRKWLIIFIIGSLIASVLLVRFPIADWMILICLATGFLGSSAAALISALDRHANGFEDDNSVQHPKSEKKKERFNDGLYYWCFTRPLLGLVVGGLAYWGAIGGFFGKVALQSGTEALAFIGLLAGFFAKTLLDVMKNVVKGVFGLR